VTRYETGEDRYIDPDHKREYTPDAFATLLTAAGFTGIKRWGILGMPHVIDSKSLDVQDYYDGELLSPSPDNAYCFAMAARS
jgi:hypothetical protein